MSNYHFEAKVISRGKGRSVTSSVSYISGQTLHDSYNGETYYNHRDDVVWQKIFLPHTAPPEFQKIQHLCDEIERAEVRWDARTARQFIASLPNELPPGELVQIVHEFIERNFVSYGLCAITAIHRGNNCDDPSRNNPHVHIVVPTRAVGPDGFCRKKDREHNKRKYISIWREQWATIQNRAYERNKLDIRVSHESLVVQGIYDRKPTIHLSHADWTHFSRMIRRLDRSICEKAVQLNTAREGTQPGIRQHKSTFCTPFADAPENAERAGKPCSARTARLSKWWSNQR